MADELIDSFVSEKGKKEIENIIAGLILIDQEIAAINKTGITLGANVKASGNLKDLTVNTIKAEQAVTKLSDMQNKAALSAIRLQAAQDKAAKSALEETTAYKKL